MRASYGKRLSSWLLLWIIACAPVSAMEITNQIERGSRLGDFLKQVIRIEWVAKQYGVQAFVTPFEGVDSFAFASIPGYVKTRRMHAVRVESAKQLHRLNLRYPLFEIPIYLQDPEWFPDQDIHLCPQIKQDTEFLAQIQEKFAPAKPYAATPTPQGAIAVALHVRQPSGRDRPLYSPQWYTPQDLEERLEIKKRLKSYIDVLVPGKFPPLQYYADTLVKLSDCLAHAPLHVHIFSDAKDLEGLKRQFQDHVSLENISFHVHQKGRSAVDDLFSMAYDFPILIRGGSGFSQMAQCIGKHEIVVYPKTMGWKGQYLVVEDEVWEHTRVDHDQAVLVQKRAMPPKKEILPKKDLPPSPGQRLRDRRIRYPRPTPID